MFTSLWSLLVAVLCLVSLLGGALYIWFYWTHWRLLRVAANLPQMLPSWPLLGHSYIIFRGVNEMTKTLLEMSAEVVKRGIKTSVFWCGPLPILAIFGADDIQMVLNSSSTAEKGTEYEFFGEILEDKSHYHLLFAPSRVWRKTRRHTNPLFHPHNLEHMQPVFNRNSRLLVDSLAERVGSKAFDINHHTMDIGLLTVCNLMFGPEVHIDLKSSAFRCLMKFVETVPVLFITKLLRPWLRVDMVFRYLYRNELIELTKCWRGFTKSSLQRTRLHNQKRSLKSGFSKMESSDYELVSLDSEDYKGQVNIVDVYTVLQKNYPEFGETDLLVDVAGFYCTGTDTIGAGVASCLLALAQYQDIQERLYLEISSVVKEDEDITLEDLNKMPFLDQVIKETLRWFMLVPYVLRKTSKDIQLSNCKVPADSTIIVALAGIHMDSNIYPNPTKFDPDRFAPDISPEKDKFTFVPFSGGSRNCIAKMYAMQLMKIMMVHVLRKFKIFTKMDIHKLNRRLVITLVSADGYLVTLENR